MTDANVPTVVPGQQPGETWEEFKARAARAFFDPQEPTDGGVEPPLITFLKRRHEMNLALGIDTYKHWCKELDEGNCPH